MECACAEGGSPRQVGGFKESCDWWAGLSTCARALGCQQEGTDTAQTKCQVYTGVRANRRAEGHCANTCTDKQRLHQQLCVKCIATNHALLRRTEGDQPFLDPQCEISICCKVSVLPTLRCMLTAYRRLLSWHRHEPRHLTRLTSLSPTHRPAAHGVPSRCNAAPWLNATCRGALAQAHTSVTPVSTVSLSYGSRPSATGCCIR